MFWKGICPNWLAKQKLAGNKLALEILSEKIGLKVPLNKLSQRHLSLPTTLLSLETETEILMLSTYFPVNG